MMKCGKVIVGYEVDGDDENTVIVGKENSNNSINIINVIHGKEAENVVNTLLGGKEE